MTTMTYQRENCVIIMHRPHTALMIMSFCNWIVINFRSAAFTRTQCIAEWGSQFNTIQRFKSKRLGYLIEDKESHLVCECKSNSIDLYNIFCCLVLFCSLSLFVVLAKERTTCSCPRSECTQQNFLSCYNSIRFKVYIDVRDCYRLLFPL